jgi:flagellar biosynthesis regulator FlaF
MDRHIEDVCRKEYRLNVKAWNFPQTIWVYVPLDDLLTDSNDFSETGRNALRKVFLILRRMLLSIDKRPTFYAVVFSDIKKKGADVYFIGHTQDMVEMEANLISMGQWRQREIFITHMNRQALNDKAGEHIGRYDLTMGEFIAGLVHQRLDVIFNGQYKENFKINALDAYFYDGKLVVTVDAEFAKKAKGLPVPYDEAVKAIRKFVDIYHFNDLSEIEIHDTLSNKHRYMSMPVFREELPSKN